MNISELFSSEERVAVLRHVLFSRGASSVNKTAEALRLSNGLISKYFAILVQEKLLVRKGRVFIQGNNHQVRAVKILLNLVAFESSMLKRYPFVKAAGIFGSTVKGTNTRDSDLDLWVYVENATAESLAALSAALSRKHASIKPVFLTQEKLHRIKTADPVFYHSLVFGSITVYGDDLEAL